MRHLPGIATLVLALACTLPTLVAAENDNAKEVGRKLDEAGAAIRDYTVEQRDEAVKNARSALEQLDSNINRLAADIDARWDKLDSGARKKAYDSMDRLRKERNDAAEWVGGLKHSSKETWGEVKDGFARSYDSLVATLRRAKDEF